MADSLLEKRRRLDRHARGRWRRPFREERNSLARIRRTTAPSGRARQTHHINARRPSVKVAARPPCKIGRRTRQATSCASRRGPSMTTEQISMLACSPRRSAREVAGPCARRDIDPARGSREVQKSHGSDARRRDPGLDGRAAIATLKADRVAIGMRGLWLDDYDPDVDAKRLEVDVWSDVVCPWCYIGKRRLEAALARFAHRDAVDVRWHSFELDPQAPRSTRAARWSGSRASTAPTSPARSR